MYCDLNNIVLSPVWLQIRDAIIAQEYHRLCTYHGHGYIFFYFDQLVRGEITTEQFLAIGEVDGQIEDQINPHVYREEHPVALHVLTPELVKQWSVDDLIIVDSLLLAYYTGQYGELVTPATVIVA